MRIKIIPSVLIILLLLSGCVATTPVKPTSNYDTNEPFTYTPEGKEQFVFKEISKPLQQFAYKDICFKEPVKSVSSECSRNQLPYDKYVGIKGYYTERAPIHKDHYVAREAVLETGRTVYMVKSTKYKHVGNKIISLKEHEKVEGFKPLPIVPGAKTLITGYSHRDTKKLKVSSQSGHNFTEDSLDAIRNIAKRYPKSEAVIADLLTTLRVDVDDFDEKVVVSGSGYNNKSSYISVKIIFSKDGKVTPFIVTHYEADDWLFVEKYSVSADDFRWNSKELDFKRDHSSGKIWEWNNSYVNDEYLTVLNKIASAGKAIIRFHGRKYYDDYVFTEIQKKELIALVELISLTK